MRILGVFALILVAIYLSFILYGQKLLSEWSKSRLELVMGNQINRKVQLGSVNLSAGWSGIILKADRLTLTDKDDKPFMIAGPVEISVGLIPLIQSRELMITKIDINTPEIWATRNSDTEWNFSDLAEMPVLQDLSRIGVHGGKLHVADVRKPKAKLDFDSIETKLDRPFFRKGWSFALSTNVRHPKLNTHIKIDGEVKGNPGDWMKHEQTIAVNVKNLLLADFVDFIGPLPIPAIADPINATLSGRGIPDQKISGKASIQTPQFTFSAQNIENIGPLRFFPSKGGIFVPLEKTDLKLTNVHFEYPQGKLAVKSLNSVAHMTKEKLSFEKTRGRFGSSDFEANGWIDANHRVDILYRGKHIYLDEVKQTLKALKLAVPPVVHQPLFGTVKEAEISIKGDLKDPQILAKARPDRLFYMPNLPKRLFELSGGEVFFDGSTATFSKLAGRLGTGTFTLDGKSGVSKNGKVDVRLDSRDIDLADVKRLIKELKIDSPLVKEEVLYGAIKSARGEIKGCVSNPSISMKVIPINLYYQPPGSKTRVAEVNGGVIGVRDQILDFNQTTGRIGNGRFVLNGSAGPAPSAPLNLKIGAENMDLSNVKTSLEAMKVQSPLLAQQLLYGVVKKVDLTLHGTPKSPKITMVAYPKDLTYQPLGSKRTVHLISGKVTYQNDNVSLEDVNIVSSKSKLRTTLIVNNLSKTPSLSSFKVHTPGLDLSDLHSYLAAPQTPKSVRERYLQEMQRLGITPTKGTVRGQFAITNQGNNLDATGDISFEDVAAQTSGFPVQNVAGNLVAKGSKLEIEKISGNLGKSAFSASGTVENFADPAARSINLKAVAQMDPNDFITFVHLENSTHKLVSSGLVPVTAEVTGTGKHLTAVFHASVPANQDFTLVGPFGVLAKPKGEPGSMSGTLLVADNKVTLQNVQLTSGLAIIKINGTYTLPAPPEGAPALDITLDLPNSLQAKNLVALLPADTMDSGLRDLSGSISGSIHLKGPPTAPAVRGLVNIKDFGVPQYKLSNVTGTISAADWVTGTAGETQSAPFDVDIQSMKLNKLLIKSIKGKLVAGYYTNKAGEKTRNISLRDITADIAKGKLKMRGWTAQGKPLFGGTADLTGVDANELFTELFDAPNEITGTMEAHVRFRADIGAGKNVYDTLEVPAPDPTDPNANARVPSSFTLVNGRVSRFSLLQRRIDQANLLKGGIIGFNLNNFLQSVAPVENGNYKSIKGSFVLRPGLQVAFGNAESSLSKFGSVEFNGDELRMRSSGTIDFKKNSMKVDVVGNIPRVSTRGFLGKAGSLFSLGGFLGVLDGLPLVPNVWSDDKPRTFRFKIASVLDQPQLMNKSIYDTFKWLPNQRDATAHPALASGNAPSTRGG